MLALTMDSGPVDILAHSALFAAFVAAAISSTVVVVLLRFAARLPKALPSARSLHQRATPRIGGLAIWAGFLPVALVSPSPVHGGDGWLAAWAVLAVVSLVDDWRGTPPLLRLIVQAGAGIAAAAMLARSPDAPWGHEAMALLVLAVGIAWSANLFNFMDGSDGLAATMAITGFASLGAASAFAGAPAHDYFAIAAAALPLFAVNCPPARMFMGDVGSVPLGFLAAVFAVAGSIQRIWPAWFPLLVFLPFLADATLTLLRRMARGERLHEAHRVHYYQRLHQLGAGHRGTLAVYAGLCIGVSATALGVLIEAPALGWAAVLVWTVLLAALFAGIDYHWNRFNQASR